MTRPLLAALLLLSVSASAAPSRIGCAPVRPSDSSESELRPRLAGPGTRVAQPARRPGAYWDLGDGRTARLSLYFIKDCRIGMTTGLGHESSSPDVNEAVADFARTVARDAPAWTLSVERPNTIVLAGAGKRYSTDLPSLLQARLDAAMPIALGEENAGLLHDGASFFLSRPDVEQSLLLLRERYLLPAWTVYDLTPYGLPRVAALLEKDDDGKDVATFWPLAD
jgi:hypothetical protein